MQSILTSSSSSFHLADKLAQRGQAVTDELQAEFTRMKEAYEVLSDPHKRETYDAIGARGMKWLDEPFSVDPQELATNFAKSSVVDRSKIFAIFVGVAVCIFFLPILICLHLDGTLGENASWTATLFPLWIWNGLTVFYHIRVIMMGPIEKPEHVPLEEWVDPLPMGKRYLSLAKFLLLFTFEFLAALKLDKIFGPNWLVVFLPYYLWELATVYKKWQIVQIQIATLEDLELAFGKPPAEFTEEEKEVVGKRYSIVPSLESEEFSAAQELKASARQELIKCGFRVIFSIFVLIQSATNGRLSWWLVFLPVWLLSSLICLSNYQAFAQVQQMAYEKDPSLFGLQQPGEEGTTSINYGAVGVDGEATTGAASSSGTNLTEDEKEELKAQVMSSASNLCSKCCSQGFLLVLICLFVAKLQGAGFSAFWIISPFLFAAFVVLLGLGLAIFGISEVPENGSPFAAATGQSSEQSPSSAPQAPTNLNYEPPSTNDNPSPPQADPEMAPADNSTPAVGSPSSQSDAQEQAVASSPPMDLLDDVESGSKPIPNNDMIVAKAKKFIKIKGKNLQPNKPKTLPQSESMQSINSI
eukprot:scaffold1340_cov122-Cylindrotheca_fusiformis.AAC.9